MSNKHIHLHIMCIQNAIINNLFFKENIAYNVMMS